MVSRTRLNITSFVCCLLFFSVCLWPNGVKTIHKKHRVLLSKKFHLLHANARPHRAARNVRTRSQMKSDHLPHPLLRSWPSYIALSHVWTTERCLAWTKICQWRWKGRSVTWSRSQPRTFAADDTSRLVYYKISVEKKGGLLCWETIHFAFVTDRCTRGK